MTDKNFVKNLVQANGERRRRDAYIARLFELRNEWIDATARFDILPPDDMNVVEAAHGIVEDVARRLVEALHQGPETEEEELL